MIAAALAAALGGCSSDTTTSYNILPSPEVLGKADWLSFSGGKNDYALRPVTTNDLIDQGGQCPPDQAMASANADPGLGPTGRFSGGIALQMTECDVVRRAGTPDNIEFGGSERGERALVLTYRSGSRPGIYRFADGRLYSIERGAEAPPQPKPQKPARPARKPAPT